jgi:hypothetical protein
MYDNARGVSSGILEIEAVVIQIKHKFELRYYDKEDEKNEKKYKNHKNRKKQKNRGEESMRGLRGQVLPLYRVSNRCPRKQKRLR